jgi:hypothetical protein
VSSRLDAAAARHRADAPMRGLRRRPLDAGRRRAMRVRVRRAPRRGNQEGAKGEDAGSGGEDRGWEGE